MYEPPLNLRPLLRLAVVMAVIVWAGAPVVTAAEPPGSAGGLPLDEQEQFARWFAPRFVFHPDEPYLPCSPLHPLEASGAPEVQTGRRRLGEVRSRVADYEQRSLASKAALSKVFFRMYAVGGTPHDTLVVEYWLYYVYSQYRARPVVFRFSADASHPNDMEHVVLVLRRRPGSTASRRGRREPRNYDVRSILASAHTMGVPDNVYNLAAHEDVPRHVRILVELGSHAMAPDINGDLQFIPEHDVTPAAKVVWGIRDRGATASRYRTSFSEERTQGAIELSPPGVRGGLTYRLEHVHALESRFDQLELDRQDLNAAFGVDVGWLKRLFGKADGTDESLIRPTRHNDYGAFERMRGGHRLDASGIGAGVTNILSSHSFFVSARYAWMNASSIIPDVSLASQAIVNGQGRDFYGVELLATYPIDTITRVFVGGGLLSDDIRFDKRQLDWITGFELTLGRFRFRQAFRSTGVVNTSGWAEFRAEWKAW